MRGVMADDVKITDVFLQFAHKEQAPLALRHKKSQPLTPR